MVIKNIFKWRKCILLILACAMAICASAKSNLFTIKQGDPLILLDSKKSAIYEIDYSKLIVKDEKDADNDMDFASWMIAQDEDNDKWTKDWEKKDKANCDKAFREKFNDEVGGIKLTKLGKHYKVTLRLTGINWGPTVNVAKTILVGFSGGEAIADGELEVRDINTEEIKLILSFEHLVGEGSVKQIGRLKGVFENLGEELSDYLKSYKKNYEKEQKKLNKNKDLTARFIAAEEYIHSSSAALVICTGNKKKYLNIDGNAQNSNTSLFFIYEFYWFCPSEYLGGFSIQ